MNPNSIKHGGPAFPCDPFVASKPNHVDVARRLAEGMSLRDYFAAKAMQAVMATPWITHRSSQVGSSEYGAEVAEECYAIADAMLKAREDT